VLAASVAVGVSIAFSINACLWIGAACYLLIGPVSVVLHCVDTKERSNQLHTQPV
jgi:hypothetical protein